MDVNFSGKRVLVTGGGNGLGRCLVKRFHEGGAAKIFTIDVDADALAKLKEEYQSIVTAIVDLRNWDETRRIVLEFGPIDVLINNAGIVGEMPDFEDINKAELTRMMEVNFFSVINVSQAVAQNMPKNGTIVNLSSVMSKVTAEGLALYSCTKAAVNMLTKSMALELGGSKGIRVNCICPSGINTQLMGQIYGRNPGKAEASLQRFIFPRPIEVDEAANLVLFLASDKSSMVTGQEYVMDGGFLTN